MSGVYDERKEDMEVQFDLSSEKSQGGVPVINVNFVDRINKIRAKTPKGTTLHPPTPPIPAPQSKIEEKRFFSSTQLNQPAPPLGSPKTSYRQGGGQQPPRPPSSSIPEMTIYMEDILKSEDYIRLKRSLGC